MRLSFIEIPVGTTQQPGMLPAAFRQDPADLAPLRGKLYSKMSQEPALASVSMPPDVETAPGATGVDEVAAFRRAVLDKLIYMVGKDPDHALDHDWFVATALAVRDRIVNRWMEAKRKN